MSCLSPVYSMEHASQRDRARSALKGKAEWGLGLRMSVPDAEADIGGSGTLQRKLLEQPRCAILKSLL